MRILLILFLSVLIGCGPSQSSDSEKLVSPALAKQLYAGEVVYIVECVACHGTMGTGTPPLANAASIVGDRTQLIDKIFNTPTDSSVHSFKHLSDEEASNVLNYIRRTIGNTEDSVSTSDIAAIRR